MVGQYILQGDTPITIKGPIVKLGIQTTDPEAYFVANGNNIIKIGPLGVYELDLIGIGFLDTITVHQASTKKTYEQEYKKNEDGTYTLIDEKEITVYNKTIIDYITQYDNVEEATIE